MKNSNLNIEKRCEGCVYLIESEKGELLCTDCYYEDQIKNISEISDEECSLMKN